MIEKQIYCPHCSTKYKVTIDQLTIAHGMVCCAKCSSNFNALKYLVTESEQPLSDQSVKSIYNNSDTSNLRTSTKNIFLDSFPTEQHLLDIFNRKIEHSNIDLTTYLNNLNYFSTDPISHYPPVKWEEKSEQHKKSGMKHYVLWGLINLCLIILLIFQFFWFNPKILNSSPAFSAVLSAACKNLHCSFMDENYHLISSNKVKVKSISSQETQFTGELINYHSKSLALPILKVNLKASGKITNSYVLTPSEYLNSSFNGIERIPQNSPFEFEFKLPVPRKNFDNYNLEIIRP